MTEAQEPTDAEKAKAYMTLSEAVHAFAGPFKVGRCPVADYDGLAGREDYAGARKIRNLFIGSKRRARWMEAWLVSKARENDPERCANDESTPSAAGEADANVVFVALW